MKQFFSVLFLFLSLLSYTQNWAPINSTEQFNYSLGDADVIAHAVKADSITVNETDSVFYFNQIMHKCDTCCIESIDTDLPEEINSFWLNGKSNIFGFKAIISSNNWSFIHETDSFLLKPYAQLDETWDYDNELTATITDISEGSVLGESDSLKYITLSNDTELILSKNHGIVKFQSSELETFDLIGIHERDLGRISLTFDEVFDFEAGDLFQYKITQGANSESTAYSKYGIEQRIITDVQEYQDSILISYDFIRNDTTNNFVENQITYEVSTGSLSQTFHRADFNTLSITPGTPAIHSSPFIDYKLLDQGFQNSNSGRRIMHYGGYNFIDEQEALFLLSRVANITFWCEDESEFDNPLDFIAKGNSQFFSLLANSNLSNQSEFKGYNCAFSPKLGYISRNYERENDALFSRKGFFMTGFIKANGEAEGTIVSEDVLLSSDEFFQTKHLTFYPNPAQTFMLVECDQRMSRIAVYSQFGKELLAESISSKSHRLELAKFSAGIYVLQVTLADGGSYSERFIKN